MCINTVHILLDIDECIEGLDIDCSVYADCVNSVGSYQCVCTNGYLGDGAECCKLLSWTSQIVVSALILLRGHIRY